MYRELCPEEPQIDSSKELCHQRLGTTYALESKMPRPNLGEASPVNLMERIQSAGS